MDAPEARLKAAIRKAITEQSGLADRELAAAVVEGEPLIIAALAPGWILDRVTGLVRTLRPRPADPGQMSFPFHDLSIRIPVKTGYVELRTATIGMLRQAERVLRKRHKTPRANSMLGKIQRQIELMEPYVQRNRRLTVEAAQLLIASGVPIPEPSKEMSDAMKRYWDAKTPEERSAIARRRQSKRRKKKMGRPTLW